MRARSEGNLKAELHTSGLGMIDPVIIKDPSNTKAALKLDVTLIAPYSLGVTLQNSVETGRKINPYEAPQYAALPQQVRTSFPQQYWTPEVNQTELDYQEYRGFSANTDFVIQGIVRGDNFEQSKIELLGVEH